MNAIFVTVVHRFLDFAIFSKALLAIVKLLFVLHSGEHRIPISLKLLSRIFYF
jgi:hypothetical protein